MIKRALYLSFVTSVVLLGATFSCGPSKKACDPSNCVGCCDTSGNCQIGVGSAACGSSGAACQACSGGQICSLGACRFQNNVGGGSAGGGSVGGGSAGGGSAGGGAGGGSAGCSQTCAGCCQGSTCLGGTATNACGTLGLSCTACTGSQACTSGICIDQNCNGCVSGGNCVATASQSDSQCGSFGVSCNDCTATGAACTNGSCTGGVCGGCRDFNGVCQPGSTRAFCGANGSTCTSCTGTGEICSSGACVSGSGGGAGGGGGGGVGGGAGGGGGSVNGGESCLNPETLGFTTVTGTTQNYIDNYQGTCGGFGPDHVYSLSVTNGGAVVQVISLSSGYVPLVYIRSSTCSTGTEVTCDATGSNAFNLSNGTYYVFVDNADGISGDYEISVSSGAGGGAGGGGSVGGGAGGGGGVGGGVGGGGGATGGGAGGGSGGQGDTCSNPLTLSFVNGSATASNDTTGFNNDYSDPNTGSCTTAGQDIVYTFTPTSSGTLTVTATAGGTSNLYPALYLRTSCTSTSSLACVGGGVSTTTMATLQSPVTAFTPYYLIVDGDSISYPGAFSLSATIQ